jgi:predicted SprT family Zn-dependent metalloprotease
MTCTCDDTPVDRTHYRDPRTGRDHVQYICRECGDRVKNPDNGRMV